MRALLSFGVLAILAASFALAAEYEKPQKIDYPIYPPAPARQEPAEAEAKSAGCVSCHTASDAKTMHASPAVVLGCTDCHGGQAGVFAPVGAPSEDAYDAARDAAHVQPLYPEALHYPSSANPERSYTLLNRESREFTRFVNPSDYRVAGEACGACHQSIIDAAVRSLMATGAMLWGGASYNNGILPFKNYVLGEAYTPDGEPAKIEGPDLPAETMEKYGVLPELLPLPSWESVRPGDVFRGIEACGSARTDSAPRGARASRHPPVEPRARHRRAYLGTADQHSQDAAERSLYLVHRYERPAGRLSLVGLCILSRRVRERSRSAPFGPVCCIRARRRKREC